MKVVAYYNGNHADEFDVNATMVMEDTEYLELIKLVIKGMEEGDAEVCIGTNEYMEITDKEFNFQFITDTEYLLLKKLNLDKTGFSHILDIGYY